MRSGTLYALIKKAVHTLRGTRHDVHLIGLHAAPLALIHPESDAVPGRMPPAAQEASTSAAHQEQHALLLQVAVTTLAITAHLLKVTPKSIRQLARAARHFQ